MHTPGCLPGAPERRAVYLFLFLAGGCRRAQIPGLPPFPAPFPTRVCSAPTDIWGAGHVPLNPGATPVWGSVLPHHLWGMGPAGKGNGLGGAGAARPVPGACGAAGRALRVRAACLAPALDQLLGCQAAGACVLGSGREPTLQRLFPVRACRSVACSRPPCGCSRT